jgi:hypothetical protein
LESNNLYKEHIRETELTKLRVLFLDEMASVQPKWTATYNDRMEERKADFDFAIDMCSDGLVFGDKILTAWLDDVEEGSENVESLRNRCLV